jgi:hypothetical protein
LIRREGFVNNFLSYFLAVRRLVLCGPLISEALDYSTLVFPKQAPLVEEPQDAG